MCTVLICLAPYHANKAGRSWTASGAAARAAAPMASCKLQQQGIEHVGSAFLAVLGTGVVNECTHLSTIPLPFANQNTPVSTRLSSAFAATFPVHFQCTPFLIQTVRARCTL